MDKNKNSALLIFLAIVVFLLASFIFAWHFFPAIFKTKGVLNQTQLVGLTQPIELIFSFPVESATVEKKLTISPATQLLISWSKDRKTLKISPLTFWNPQTTYQLSILGGENVLHFKFNQELTFSTQPYPKIKTLLPIEGEKNVAIDIEEPIMADFDSSLEDYNVKFEVEPALDLAYQLSPDKNKIKLLAKDNFAWQTQYKIGVFLKYKKQPAEQYLKVGQTSFETAQPPPTEWDKDPASLLAQAEQYTKPVIATGKYIDVSLKYQVMVIFEDGRALNSYRISSGKRGLETPTGQFKIENKSPRAWSGKYGLFMPNWMAILPSGKVGIHELPVWPGGYQEGASHLGIPVSHGCIRLGSEPAKRVYAWAEIGTPVVVHE
jgi:lipoprotein-anchoring transpeptidase ErfK/SrfK